MQRMKMWKKMLYLIKKLHQITAQLSDRRIVDRLYLIKKLHQITAWTSSKTVSLSLYLIKKLHQITACMPRGESG